LQDFFAAEDRSSSDNSYVLRKMLSRGIKEAQYRYYINEGDKAFEYKKLMFELEDLLDNLDSMIGENVLVYGEHRVKMMETIKLCQCLLAIDQAETNADYNNLVAYLTHDLCECCREEALAA
jgi:hypothetical protein